MNPVGLYHDPSLDPVVTQNTSRVKYNGTSGRSSGGQSGRSFSDVSDPLINPPPVAPEVPRGPQISYRGQSQGDAIPQRSFSQRAKGRPFHREAFADMDEEHHEEVARPKARVASEPARKGTSPAIPRKIVPADGLRLNTANLNGPSMATAPRKEIQSARESTADQAKVLPKPRRTSDTPRNIGEPVSAVSKSSAFRDEVQRRDWAPDRSPLQKLEVTLNDISKEEKRARVQEAEMLLRERDAKALRGNIESSPLEPATIPAKAPSTGRSVSTRERAPEPQAPTLEDAGLVRNLSTTQRQRLQHSTTVDSHRPDARRLSGEGPAGFAYTISSPLQPGAIRQPRQSSGKYRGQDEPIRDPATSSHDESYSPGGAERAQIRFGKQRERSTHDIQGLPSDTFTVRRASHASAPSDRLAPAPGGLGDGGQRSASRKAALDKLTGVSEQNNVVRSGSRKLQKIPPGSLDHVVAPAGRVPSRIPVPSSGTAARARAPDPLDQGLSQPKMEPSRPQQSPHTPPVGLGLQSSPHPSSPQSPPTRGIDVTRQRQRKSSVSFKEPVNNRPVDEWKEAETARLTAADFSTATAAAVDKGQAWWEQPATSSGRRRSRSSRISSQPAPEPPIDDRTAECTPRLYMRCGPLLRYKGMRRQKNERGEEREFWRGSVLIVTQNSHSVHSPPPTLRLFSQPQKLLPPPPHHVTVDELEPEYVDPIAGLTRISRTGRALFVRPVDHLEEGKDLSQMETEDGLFESSPSPPDLNGHPDTSATANKRTLDTDGEKVGRFQEVAGARLYADPDRDVTFWRFDIEVELGNEQQHIAYRINRGASVGFWVPARGQTMNIMFHTCNGFSLSVNPDNLNGPDPMWRDVLNTHQTRPFHVMIGGGDQIYNDRVMLETQHFGEWTRMRNQVNKHHAPFTPEMKEELESFYLNRYAMWFSQGLFGMAAGQIPMVNIWDDHDIIDGFGSYTDHFMQTPVFSGLGNVAFKYYMLFQHQSVPEETAAHEPSWLLGREPGPYIKQLSRSVFMHLGKQVAFLGLDCRTERMRHEVLSVDTLEIVLERCRKELVEGETKHLIILLGVPIAYPRLVWLENVLTSRLMDPVKALGRVGVLKGGFLNKFDGGVEILDDLDDHWTATSHKHERNELIKDLQDLAAEKSCRITILSGDVHLAAIGQFHSNPKLKIPKDRDHRYMPNVISSAITNTPPSDMLADILNKRNKTHQLDRYTDENMIPMFTHDVNNKKRNNRHLLPRRNWCSIQEYVPGSTPPPTPPAIADLHEAEEDAEESRPRRFSFSKEDVDPRNLLRKLSSRKAPPTSYRDTMYEQGRSASHDGTTRSTGQPLSQNSDASGSRQPSFDFQATPARRASSFDHSSSSAPLRPAVYQRRPTNLSGKAVRKGNIPAVDAEGNEIDVNDHVNLEGGLDVVLNVEVNSKDPSGITVPYRLLVPALWYDGSSDREKLDEATEVQRRPSLLNRLGLAGRKGRKDEEGPHGEWGQEQSEEDSYSEDEEYSKAPPRRRRFSLFGSRAHKKEDQHSDTESEGEGQPSAEAPGPQPPPWQVPNDTIRPSPGAQIAYSAPPPASFPNHDMLYDTEHRPPPTHSLEPAPHPSVTRSLTISSSAGRFARMNPDGGAIRNVSENYPIQHPGPDQSPRAVAGSVESPISPTTRFANTHRDTDFPQRRLSKQERVLGITSSGPGFYAPPQPLRGNGLIGNSYQQDYEQANPSHGPARGYTGMEAYQEPKARRTFSLKKARNWFEGRHRGEEFD